MTSPSWPIRCPASPATSKRSKFQRPVIVASVMVDRCSQFGPADASGAGSDPPLRVREAELAQGATAPKPPASEIRVKLKLVTDEVRVPEPRSTHAPPLNRSTDDTTM